MPAHPLILAHRGAHRSASTPENSHAAFEQALKQGCDGFECDVRLTQSGRAVICHDEKVNGVLVSSADRKQLLHLPCVEEVIQRYGQNAFLDIELKVSGLEAKVLSALREFPPEREYVISSFLVDVILELKARSAVVPVGIICEKANQLVAWRKLPVDYVIVHKSLITKKLVQLIQSAGRKIMAWTINDKRSMAQLAGWGVDGLISDNPVLLRKTLRSAGSKPSTRVD